MLYTNARNAILQYAYFGTFLKDPKRKSLVTGSIPTENLPKKRQDLPTKVRRILVSNTRPFYAITIIVGSDVRIPI